jgi:protoporphyrinogen oxidase
MSSTRTAIVGAGASGLSVALMLDGDVTIFESGPKAAGFCAATVRDGFTFDRGPHIMFSRDGEVLDFMVRSLRGNVHRSRRANRIAIGGRFVKYPIENDLAGLPEDLRNRCLMDFLFNDNAKLTDSPANLHEWFLGHFGKGLTDLYFKPYNEKVWNVPLAQLSMTWAERIPQPPAPDVVKGALGISTEGYLHQLHYHYPELGGYEAIPAAWAAMLPSSVLRLNTPVQRIVPGGEGVDVITSTGTERFDRVVCTAPMPSLLQMLGDPPDRVRAAVDSLQVNPMAVITLGFAGVDRNEFTAIYFPDPEFLVNRASTPSVFSPKNAPQGCYSIQAEIVAAPSGNELKQSDEDLLDHVRRGLIDHSVVTPDQEVVFADVQRFEYAYVVYTVGYERHVRTVHEWAESKGVYLHGRFGAFEYVNVDGCVIRSRELATRLNGRPTSLPTIEEPMEAGE